MNYDFLGFVNQGNPGLSDAGLSEFQEELDTKLPSAYVDFLRTYNGGTSLRRVFLLNGAKMEIESWIGFFSYDEFREEYGSCNINGVRTEIDWGLGETLTPIARIVGGNYVCIDCKSDSGEVVFWNRDKSEVDKPWVTGLAVSFYEFILLLEKCDK